MTTRRRRHPLTAGVVVMMLVAGAAGLVLAAGNVGAPQATAPRSTSGANPDDGMTSSVPLSRSRPVTLRIPGMGLDTPLVALDATDEGLMELPPVNRAGWYTGSVTPGEVGTTIIAGYIRRSTSRPGAFKDLRRLKTGDRIAVTRADGTTATYVVTRIESYEKGAFPASEVYAGGAEPQLRLVTTGGALESGDPLGNVAVFARFTGSTNDRTSGP